MPSVFKLAYLVTHPIQYQSPLLRRVASEPDIQLKVFYCSDVSTRAHFDPGFGRTITWDVPLTDGIAHEFLPAIGSTDRISFWKPFNSGLLRRLKAGGFHALWIHGYARWFHLWTMGWARLLGIKVFVRDEVTSTSKQRSPVRRLLKRLLFRYLDWSCAGFLAIGTANADYYRSNKIPDSKIFLVPYAVDNDYFIQKIQSISKTIAETRKSINAADERPIILCVSKLTERKRVGDLLTAFRQLSTDGKTEPAAHLVFAGDGPLAAEMEQTVRGWGWSCVHFLGFVGMSDTPAWYKTADIFVLPSVFEPWGLVCNEAMTAGKPLVLSDQVGAAPDLLRDGENGFLFPAGNIGALRDRLQQLIQSPDLRASMGKKSFERILTWSFNEDVAGIRAALVSTLRQSR